jgi:hypothetical protein
MGHDTNPCLEIDVQWSGQWFRVGDPSRTNVVTPSTTYVHIVNTTVHSFFDPKARSQMKIRRMWEKIAKFRRPRRPAGQQRARPGRAKTPQPIDNPNLFYSERRNSTKTAKA